MGKRESRPRRGSLAYMPRVRAPGPVARVRSWPGDGRLGLQGIAGYKAGMLQVFMIDDKKGSLTSGQEICVPVTVIETPPLTICAVRLYASSGKGPKSASELWATELPEEISRKIKTPKRYDHQKSLENAEKAVLSGKIYDVRVIACTRPRLTTLSRKKPDLIEIRVGGGSIDERWKYAKELLGKQVRASEVFKEGEYADVLAITKGKGFQGPVKRWGIKILPRKSEGGRRQVGSLGPWSPPRIMWSVPAPGQMGYHQRTEFNKRILKIGSNGSEITPKGGFLRYGPVRTEYLVLSGSVPGPTKRLIQIRKPIRAKSTFPTAQPTITHIDLSSPQGI
ncbi:MAG: 50S ribosomal protein L3 [Candidatus Hadarchaeales archaeon]